MGRLGKLTILLTLSAWGVTTEGSPPGGSADGSTRPALSAPAGEYLKGGIKLFNQGNPSLAVKYLKVANDYRDQLQPSEQAQLDEYWAKVAPAPTDSNVVPASTASAPDSTSSAAAGITARKASTNRGTTDLKQEARWKLQSAKEQMRLGNYDEADKLVAQVQQMPVKWGLFDETPDRVGEAITKARPKLAPGAATAPTATAHTKANALAKLKEARGLLESGQPEQAEAIALDVDSWGISFGRWEEKPSKVAAAARVLRNRNATRALPVKAQPSQGVYDVLVAEARHHLTVGDLDQAELKAQQAARMKVVPALTADRAEAVLADIETARSQQIVAAVQPAGGKPATESPSIVAERQANELLAQGQSVEAAAKLVQADRLKAQEMAVAPTVDVAISRVRNDDPANMPGLDAPAPTTAPAGLDATMPAPAAGDPMVLPDPSSPPSPALPALSADAPADGNKGVELLTQAKALFSSSNYPAAREKATEAKTGGYGVDAQADEILAQIALSEQGGALAIYETALDAIRKNDIGKARALLNEVASSGSAVDEGMMQKVQNLLMKLPKDDNGKATASDMPTNDVESLKAQQMNAEVGSKVAEARRMTETDPDKAIAQLNATLASIKAADLPPAVSRTMVRRVEVAIELAKKDKVEFDKKMLVKDEKAKIELKKLAILEADKVKREQVDKYMKDASKAEAEGNYAKAEELARKALEVDPMEIAATVMASKANMQRHYEQDKRTKLAKEEGVLNAWQDVDKAMVIDTDAARNGISYPKDFSEIAKRRREMALRDNRPKSNDEVSIERKLNEPITLNMKDMSLSDATAYVSNYTGLNVLLDSKALNDEGLSHDSKISLQANSIKLKSALKFMLRPLNLTYKVEDGVLLITSPQASRDKTVMWHYPVADLVISPGKATANNALANPIAVAEPSAISPSNGVPVVKENQRVVTESDMIPLINLITNTIAPGTWRVTDPTGKSESAYGMGGGFNGGGGGADDDRAAQPGSITPFMLSISLIIRHTAEVHEEVAELLKQLRRLQDLQVSIEVRFITVSDDFFEQIGVDFDFNIQSDAVGKKTTFAAPNPAAALFPFNSNINGGTTTGGSTSTTGGATTTAGGGAGTAGNTTTGTTTGGTSGGGTGTGTGGISGGGFAGGGGGIGGAGNFGGGTASGNTSGTTAGGAGGTAGSTAGGTASAAYLVNPFLDHSLGNRTPVTVGTSAGGLRNFTSNLGIPLIQGSASQIAPFNTIQSAGATFGISFLSDLEMYLFLTAAQGDARNNIVQAPKVTSFNGASATIVNQQQQNYIQSLNPIVGAGAVAFQPTIGTLPDGVSLTVTPVVSADRRYVRLSLAPQFTTVDALTTLTFPSGAVGGGGLGGGATTVASTVQLPQTTVTFINTTVTVPDGGTVLLGGVKRLREQRLEYGVPVLAKTPLVNRLFRNVGVGRRTDSLMLMVTPRIIILEEEEARIGVQTVNPNP